jgi:hypothetical protein
MIKKSFYIFVCIFLTHCTFTQIENSNNLFNISFWDLSYESILKRNNIGQDEFISEWNKTVRKELPIKNILSKWDKEPIKSSILIDGPNFHNGEQLAYWFVGTSNNAYLWKFGDGRINIAKGEPVDFNLYSTLLNTVSEWQQMSPFDSTRSKKFAEKSKGIPLGYIGFLSIYHNGISKQILLSVEDFYDFENSTDKKDMLGRTKIFLSITAI